MNLNIILLIVFGAILFTGMIDVTIYLYSMVVTDAKVRGMRNAKVWGALSLGGNNSSGLLLYLIGRRKCPIVHISEKDLIRIKKCKKAIRLGLLVIVIGAIGIICTIFL